MSSEELGEPGERTPLAGALTPPLPGRQWNYLKRLVVPAAAIGSLLFMAWAGLQHMTNAPPTPTTAATSTAPAASMQMPAATQGSFSFYEYDVDFLDFPQVQDHLTQNFGISQDAIDSRDWTILAPYVPRGMSVKGYPDLIHGNVGSTAAGGYVAFNLYKTYPSFYTSYTVVMDYAGRNVTVLPMTTKHKDSRDVAFAIDALKVYNWEELLVGLNLQGTEQGPAARLRWRAAAEEGRGTPREEDWVNLVPMNMSLCMNAAHDLQLDRSPGGDVLWQACQPGGCACPHCPEEFGTGTLVKYALEDEKVIGSWDFPGTNWINHAQIFKDEEERHVAVVSDHGTNEIVKFDLHTNEVLWRCSGNGSTMPLLDIEGNAIPEGTLAWAGQHNVEYIGNGEYALFNNAMYVSDERGAAEHALCTTSEFVSDSSELLIVQIDEQAHQAQIVWQYNTGDKSTVFGDCDRLPTGNLLGTSWASEVGPIGDLDSQYDSRIYEVVRPTLQLAWEAKIHGPVCDENDATFLPADGYCHRQNENVYSPASDVWKAYSVERFFEAPLVTPSVSCSGNEAQITATVWGITKSPTVRVATWTAFDLSDGGATQVTGNVTLNTFWRPTDLSVQIPFSTGYFQIHDPLGKTPGFFTFNCDS